MAAGEFTPPNLGALPVSVIDAHDEAITPRKNLAFLDDAEQTPQPNAEQIKRLTLEFEAADKALLWQTTKLNFEKGRILCDLKELLLEQKRGAWQAWLDDHKLPRQTAEDLIDRYLTDPLPEDDPSLGTDSVPKPVPLPECDSASAKNSVPIAPEAIEKAFTGIGHPCKSNHYRNAIRGQEGLYAEWGFKIGIDGQPGLSPITLEHYQNFENALPFVLKLAERYALEMPVEYVTQLAMADKVSDFVIPRTPFSTVYTLTAPTRCHRDGGNLQGVAQVLTPLGRFTGGDFILPRFGVAITMRPGDLLFTDGQKEIHGNIPNIKGDRICVICYLHESLLEQ